MLSAGRLCGSLLPRQNPRLGAASIAVLPDYCCPTSRPFRHVLPCQTARYFRNFGRVDEDVRRRLRLGTTTPSGAILPEPKGTPYGLLYVVAIVVASLIIGSKLSERGVYYLEKSEFFSSSGDGDDDDDDDDDDEDDEDDD